MVIRHTSLMFFEFIDVSRQHLSKYCDEFSFRWNWRKVNDGIRTEKAIKGIDDKRLMYRDLVGI